MGTHQLSSHRPNQRKRCTNNFQKVRSAFLSQAGLPFAELLSGQVIEKVFAKHHSLFGTDGIYSTALMLWSFLGQVLRDGKESSCQSAVARIVCYCEQMNIEAPTCDTGDYCRARAKLSEAALHELTGAVAGGLEAQAGEAWLWKGRHAKLIDGFTFTMPDTPANQAEYPQAKTQKPGVGQPIARGVAIVSLATGCVLDAAIGPYSGKETGETALLRPILPSLETGDLVVMDRYYCSFMMIALRQAQGTDVCARCHQLRRTDFRRGRRLGKDDHLITWTRPQRPAWMDNAMYEQMPATLELREIRHQMTEKGQRPQELIIITTLTDPEQYPKQEIAELYGFRWNAELDIRSLKSSLNLDHLRCKTPPMIRREFWVTLLAYNLIRTTAASAALLHGKQPRQISFTATCQYILASWMSMACDLIPSPSNRQMYLMTLLSHIACCQVADRPGRFEPRVVKRRPKSYLLMQEPRAVLKRKFQKQCA